ncbi:MAG: DNA-binding protein [Defluviitaleaceae bacterium]|nr:DNA-binding protein [Defluviitaleaceae bacterium]
MFSGNLPMEQHFKNLLFDFYGALLTEHQRICFSLYHMEDNSLAEIGEELDITPQAVSDMLKRTTKKLERYEEKLGLVQRFMISADTADYMRQLIETVPEPTRTKMAQTLDALIKT